MTFDNASWYDCCGTLFCDNFRMSKFTINSLSDLAASGPSQEWRLINLLGTILRDDLVGTAGAVSTTMGVATAGGSKSEVVVGDSSTTIIHRHLSLG